MLYPTFKLLFECYIIVLRRYFLSFFYLMVKSGKSFVKIGSRFRIVKFPSPLRLLRSPPPPPPHPAAYLILPNGPTFPLIRILRLFGTQEYLVLQFRAVHLKKYYEDFPSLKKMHEASEFF